MEDNKIIFSGIQPTGILHLGNYFGALKQWLSLQEKYQGIFCIVDYHAITVPFQPQELPKNIINTAIDYLALGLDSKKNIIFVQSQVPEHTELTWIFNTITPVSELERMTQYKEKAREQKINVNAGLLTYPLLMAADILLYKAIGVPVGEDQVQHVELARTIARKFNRIFGQTFPEPKVMLSSGARIMSLSNPEKKMSKSLGPKNYIALADSPEIIREKVMKAVTDLGPKPEGGKKSPAVANLFELLGLFTDIKTLKIFESEYEKGQLKYEKLKTTLANAIINTLKPFQEVRKTFEENPKKIKKILAEGAKRAQKMAAETLKEVKEKMGLV